MRCFPKRIALVFIFICIIALPSCYVSRQLTYYSDRNNYITATGTVTHIAYNDDKSGLYISLSDLTYKFDDNCFKLVGKNLKIAQEHGIDEILELGAKITIVTAPKYWGDGYVMPIVAISFQDEAFLDFEQGYANLIEWLEE